MENTQDGAKFIDDILKDLDKYFLADAEGHISQNVEMVKADEWDKKQGRELWVKYSDILSIMTFLIKNL